jgi:hypothetical protein
MQRRAFVVAAALTLALPSAARAAVCPPDPDQFTNGDLPAGEVLCAKGRGPHTQARRARRRARRQARRSAG